MITGTARTIIIMVTAITTMTTGLDAQASDLPLLAWLSPNFPVGAFAYSHGFEWAVEAGDIKDAATLEAWIGALFAFGAARTDALLLAAAWRAAKTAEAATLREVNELALALAPSAERYLEISAQGNAFLAAARAAWPCAALDLLAEIAAPDVAYPIALGTAAAGHAIALRPTIAAFALAFAANLVSAGLRLGVIGQTDGQRITARAAPRAEALAGFAVTATLADLGGCALRADIASMRHETQYSRLFRS